MLIDRRSNSWVVCCTAILLIAAALYIVDRHQSAGQPTGGSWWGLTFGFAGSAAMLVAMLLAVRKHKKLRAWRLGRTYYWMQAHVWFGLLSYPLILFHAGSFHWGGPLTQWLMWLFTFTILTGIVGIILQQFLPGRLLRDVPGETILDQVPHVLGQIRREAESVVGPLRVAAAEQTADARGRRGGATMVAGSGIASLKFYTDVVEPFLGDRFQSCSELADERSAAAAFAEWPRSFPLELHPSIDQLRALVDERRQLHRQQRLQWWLTSWLLVHVPISYAVVGLAIIHAVMAFRFTSPGG